jgi:tRNA A-37 threonylcarbamoyl transferase component Bud32
MNYSECPAASLRDHLGRHLEQSSVQTWRIDDDDDGPWIWVAPETEDIPSQGWKLHLSATVASAVAVLDRALPILLSDTASFKLTRSLADLQSLNEGRSGYSQVGKFITIYPLSDAQAVRLAEALDKCTAGIPHPDIPSDRPLKPGSVVHYRYGSFGQQEVRVLMGQVLPALQTPAGAFEPDRRTVPFRQPDWVTDPFVASGVAASIPERGRLLAERYLIVHTLDESARGSIHLGADIVSGRRCLLKRAARDAQVDETGRGATDRLRHEAELLRRFAGALAVPEVLDVVEEGDDVYLAMQDVEGETLSDYVQRLAGSGRLLSTEEVVGYGLQLTSLLAALHERGVVHRDVKSENVVIGTDGRLWLMDFEIAHDLNGPSWCDGRGTQGYMSPQAGDGAVPTVLDDVYSLGAVLYFLATAAEPSLAPADAELTRRPVSLINDSITSPLESAIERCLAPRAESRIPTMAAVGEALERSLGPSRTVAVPQDARQLTPSDRAAHARLLARRLGDSLCAAASRDQAGMFWVSAHDEDGAPERRYLGGGTAGVLLALAELVAQFDDPHHRQALAEGARWLAQSQPIGTVLPGLYVGESGVAASLLRAGQVLKRPDLVGRAATIAGMVAALPHASPDIFHGSAGRLRLHLWLWRHTREAEHLSRAVEAGEYLLERCERPAEGQARWTIPPGYEDLSGDAYLGYAHGAAGIADALLDLFLASGDGRFLEASESAGRWLVSKTIRLVDDCLNWPTLDSPGDPAAGAFWCHGAAGIGRFFLNLSTLGGLPEALTMAEGAARTVSVTSRSAGPTQCHGIAGNIEFLLDMFQVTRRDEFLDAAWRLARILQTFSRERDGHLVWLSDGPRTITTDYIVGYAGVATCLLRLGAPESRPHVLTLRGFDVFRE